MVLLPEKVGIRWHSGRRSWELGVSLPIAFHGFGLTGDKECQASVWLSVLGIAGRVTVCGSGFEVLSCYGFGGFGVCCRDLDALDIRLDMAHSFQEF